MGKGKILYYEDVIKKIEDISKRGIINKEKPLGVTECNLTKEDVGKYNPRNWKYKDKRPDNCPLVKI